MDTGRPAPRLRGARELVPCDQGDLAQLPPSLRSIEPGSAVSALHHLDQSLSPAWPAHRAHPPIAPGRSLPVEAGAPRRLKEAVVAPDKLHPPAHSRTFPGGCHWAYEIGP